MRDYDLDQAKNDYPEIVTPLADKLYTLENRLGSLSHDMSNVKSVAQRIQQGEQEANAERHRQTITARHPDAYEIADSDDFSVWKCNQAPIIQRALNEGCAQDVISALDLYRQSHQRHDQQKRTFTNQQISKMSIQEFNQHEAEIDQAFSLGEVW